MVTGPELSVRTSLQSFLEPSRCDNDLTAGVYSADSERLIENDRQMMANQKVMMQNQQEFRDEQKSSLADLQNQFKALFEEYRGYMDQIHQKQLMEKDSTCKKENIARFTPWD